MPTDKQIMNARAAELNDDNTPYFEEMKEEWLKLIEQEAKQFFENQVMDADDRPTIDAFVEYLQSEGEYFEFQDYENWFSSEVSSAADTYGDMKYDEMRDRELEVTGIDKGE